MYIYFFSPTQWVTVISNCVLRDFQTPFIRHNTPHPKELKLKAKQLFGKGKPNEISSEVTTSENVRYSCFNRDEVKVFFSSCILKFSSCVA